MLWFYEVGNGLMMACRRKRMAFDQIEGFLTRLKTLPIDAAQQNTFRDSRITKLLNHL